MSSETIWNRVSRKPFTPFRINTSDGKHYDVTHPEMFAMSKNRVTINIYDPGETPGVDLASREVYVSPLHVTSVEALAPRRNGNGPRRRR